MPKYVIAKRYAEAVARIAREDATWSAWADELELIAGALARPPLRLILESPRTPLDRKLALVDQAIGTELRPATKNFLTLVLRRGHIALLDEIRVRFEAAAEAARGIERYGVTTAVPLDEAGRQHLRERLGSSQFNTIILEERTDPEILGGMVIRRGDVVQDYSVRGRLRALRELLVQAGV